MIAYEALNLKLPKIKHYFFGRNGGVSSNDFASLNISFFSKDKTKNIINNRNIIAESFNNISTNLITLKQVHSNKCIFITKKNIPSFNTEGDALVTLEPNLILGVYTADCAPILITNKNQTLVAAIHAGWKGAFSLIIENTLKVINKIGEKNSNLIAAIGPCIHQNNYEIDSNFYNNFIKQNINNAMFFIKGKKPNSYYFSLPNYIKHKLLNLGINNIEDLQLDTYSNPKLFFSHRYATHKKIDRGLELSAITLNKKD